MTAGWRRWLRIWRRTPEVDVDAELRFHMETRVDDLVARGSSPEAARAQALAEFGDVEAARAAMTEIDRRMASRRTRADWWEAIAQDLRHTLRGLARSPGFTVMVVVTLALGIGANAAVFAVLNRLFLATPAGVPHPAQVRRLIVANPSAGRLHTRSVFNYPEFRSIARAQPPSVRLAGYVPEALPYGRDASAPERPVEFAVGDYLGMLGVQPLIGRFFSGEELQVAGLTPVAVISRRLWLRDFGGSPAVLGRPLDLGAHRYTIIGVAADGFAGLSLDQVDIWLPFNCWGWWVARDPTWYDQTGTQMIRAVARASSASAMRRVAPAAAHALRTDGIAWDSTVSASLTPLRGAGDPEFYQRQDATVQRLALVAAIILLIACANVTNLALGRALSRRHETAVRLALGVSRRRLVLRALSESVVVALIAGVAAALAATWATAVLRRLVLPTVAWGATPLDGRATWFAATLSLVAGLAVGIVPAVQGSDPDLMASLRRDARGAGHRRGRVRSALVVMQAALSVVLLAGAGLFLHSLLRVESIDLGYDVPNVLFVSPRAGEDTAAARALQARLPLLAERLARVPGVVSASLMYMPPMWGLSWIDTYLADGDSVPGASTGGAPLVLLGSPGFLSTLGVHAVAGRLFSAADRAGAEPVLVVNRALAKAYWPGRNPLGQCLILEKRADTCRRIVGVVGDVHVAGLVGTPGPAYFVPLGQAPVMRTAGTIAVRTVPGRKAAVRTSVAEVVRGAVGPRVRPGIESMDDLLDPQYRQWRMGAVLFSLAGVLALLVAAVGIYSTVSYEVRQRTHEIGLRLALGARGSQIAGLVVGEGVRTVLVGIAIGVVAAIALGLVVGSLLYDTPPWDPPVLAATGVILTGVACLACLIPARRAARVDPMTSLREE